MVCRRGPPTKRELDEPLISDVDQESNQIIGYYSAYDNFQQSTSSVKKALLERLTSCSLTSEETFMRGTFR